MPHGSCVPKQSADRSQGGGMGTLEMREAVFMPSRWVLMSLFQSNNNVAIDVTLSLGVSITLHVSFVPFSLSFLTSCTPLLVVRFTQQPSNDMVVGLGGVGWWAMVGK